MPKLPKFVKGVDKAIALVLSPCFPLNITLYQSLTQYNIIKDRCPTLGDKRINATFTEIDILLHTNNLCKKLPTIWIYGIVVAKRVKEWRLGQ